MHVIDCRSDLVARPTEEMVEAMALALREPGSFGLREDPRQRRLESAAAHLLGKEDALLFPTCTMANQTAILALARPGEAVLTSHSSHIVTSEAGAPGALAGVLIRTFPDRAGQIDLDVLANALSPAADELRPRTALVELENTHNRAAGACLSPSYLRDVAELAAPRGVAIHLDGARLFNAAVALGCGVAELARHATTVAVSLNKGLCAPAGAILAGPASVIRDSARLRQRLGGGIRPTGFLAAAGLIALEKMIPRLAEDHANAARAAAGIGGIAGLTVTVPTPMTNIVLVRIAPALGPTGAFLERLKEQEVLALPFGEDGFRLVFHRDVDEAATQHVITAVGIAADAPRHLRG